MIAVGDDVQWGLVPSGALVISDAVEGVYTMRLGILGLHVGGPASWVGWKDEPWSFWTWSGFGLVKIVALGLTGEETADELRALAGVHA